jgi:hypothetical protein
MLQFYFRFHEWIIDSCYSVLWMEKGFRLMQMGLGVGLWIVRAFIYTDENRCGHVGWYFYQNWYVLFVV